MKCPACNDTGWIAENVGCAACQIQCNGLTFEQWQQKLIERALKEGVTGAQFDWLRLRFYYDQFWTPKQAWREEQANIVAATAASGMVKL